MNAKRLFVLATLCLTVLFSTVVASFGQQPQEDDRKYKKFEVLSALSREECSKELFSIRAGGITINVLYPKERDLITLLHGINETFVTQCRFLVGRGKFPPNGNLDLVKEPNFYKEGFSEQDGIVTYKKGNECLHLNIFARRWKGVMTRDLDRLDMVGKKANLIYLDDISPDDGLPFRAGKERMVLPIVDQTIPAMIYEYRFWKNGKEVKYQPDINRFGPMGTYGDDEPGAPKKSGNKIITDYRKKPSPKTPSSYGITTLVIREGKDVNIASLKLQFQLIPDAKDKVTFHILGTDGLELSFARIEERDLSLVKNPLGFTYSPYSQEGIVVTLGEPIMIKVRSPSKGTKYLAIKGLKLDRYFLTCQEKLWSEQAVDLLAQGQN